MKDKFAEFEKKITQQSTEILEGNKQVHYKEKEIEELNRRLTQMEDDYAQKARANKNTVDEQLHAVKMQHASDLKNQQEEARRLRDTISKLEDRLKNAIQSDQNKDRQVMEAERKYAELSDKINSVTSQMKIERDNNDRLCLENEELLRKLMREEARHRKAQEDIKEFEVEFNVHRTKNEEIKRQLVEEKEQLLKRERPLNSEEDQMKLGLLSRKVADLKEKLKIASDKLVKHISEKVILMQKLRDAGIDVNNLTKGGKHTEIHIQEIVEKGNCDHARTEPCPVHHHTVHDHGHHHHLTVHEHDLHHHHLAIPVHPPIPTSFAPALYDVPHYGGHIPLSHEPKVIQPMVSVETTPFTSTGFQTSDQYLVPERTYQANAADLSEEELQMKIRQLLTQKETFFTNA